MDDTLTADMVGLIIEKALIKIGIPTYDKVLRTLQLRYATFADCYRNPEMLNITLKQLFGDASASIIDEIKKELQRFDEQENVARFIKIISR